MILGSQFPVHVHMIVLASMNATQVSLQHHACAYATRPTLTHAHVSTLTHTCPYIRTIARMSLHSHTYIHICPTRTHTPTLTCTFPYILPSLTGRATSRHSDSQSAGQLLLFRREGDVCICVCVYVYVCVRACVCVCVYVCLCMNVFTIMYPRVCVFADVLIS